MYCNSCNQSCQNSGSQNNSLSDFFPAGYRVESGYPRYPYYVSVPVFLEEEDDCDCNNNCNNNCNNCCHCCCHCCHCCCEQNRPCPREESSSNYNRIRCTTRFCRQKQSCCGENSRRGGYLKKILLQTTIPRRCRRGIVCVYQVSGFSDEKI